MPCVMYERLECRKGGQIKREIRATERKTEQKTELKRKKYEKGKY